MIHSLRHSKSAWRRFRCQPAVNIVPCRLTVVEEFGIRAGIRFASSFHSSYRTFEEIQSHLLSMVATNPGVATLGQLSSGALRLRLSKDTSSCRPQIWIQGGLHSHEWIGTATVMYLADTLLSSPSSELLEKADVHLVPVVNVDGYIRNWTEDRFAGHTSNGVNPNLNFPTAFRQFPWYIKRFLRPDRPESHMYAGPQPLSELCCQAVADEMRKLKSLKLFIDLHAHGQKLMFPYAHSSEPCPHEEVLRKAADAASKAVEGSHGRRYEVLQASHLEVPVGGTMLDWVYTELRVPHSYVVELRPEFLSKLGVLKAALAHGSFKAVYYQGFELPEDQIEEVGEEIYAGIVEIAKHAISHP